MTEGRPPTPRWMCLLFGLGPACALATAIYFDDYHPRAPLHPAWLTALVYVSWSGVPLLAGLSLAVRLFQGSGARFFGAILFGCLFAVAAIAVLFVACKRLQTNNR